MDFGKMNKSSNGSLWFNVFWSSIFHWDEEAASKRVGSIADIIQKRARETKERAIVELKQMTPPDNRQPQQQHHNGNSGSQNPQNNGQSHQNGSNGQRRQ